MLDERQKNPHERKSPQNSKSINSAQLTDDQGLGTAHPQNMPNQQIVRVSNWSQVGFPLTLLMKMRGEALFLTLPVWVAERFTEIRYNY